MIVFVLELVIHVDAGPVVERDSSLSHFDKDSDRA